MKILILVLSYNHTPYDILMKAQQETWDSINEPGVSTIFYYGGLGTGQWCAKPCDRFPDQKSYELCVNATDEYYYMAAKFKEALLFVNEWDYDYIFRTNSSSYVNKRLLKEYAAILPNKDVYAGWEIDGNGYNVVSGAGFFLTKDTAQILLEKIDPEFEREEDVYCAQIMHESGIKIINNKTRVDVNTFTGNEPINRYHYRFKGSHGDRSMDAKNMILLHQKLNNSNVL